MIGTTHCLLQGRERPRAGAYCETYYTKNDEMALLPPSYTVYQRMIGEHGAVDLVSVFSSKLS